MSEIKEAFDDQWEFGQQEGDYVVVMATRQKMRHHMQKAGMGVAVVVSGVAFLDGGRRIHFCSEVDVPMRVLPIGGLKGYFVDNECRRYERICEFMETRIRF